MGFDPYKVLTYKDKALRTAVALEKAKANTESEALSDPKKKAVFNRYMRDVEMAGFIDDAGKYAKGIEDEVPKSQYQSDTHQAKVIEDILDGWVTLSQNNQFHALFATDSIPDAIEYYRLFKKAQPALNVTALFDPNIDNEGERDAVFDKQDGLIEIIEDYNQKFDQDFSLANHAKFKKDIAARLAHKAPYLRIHKTPEQQIDLLIVVDQMLTGFDSKWLNTLYMDKVLRYENIIQAFSRTNRLFNISEKPFGTIRYYRYPHSMERNVNDAIKLYSGDKPICLFVDKLDKNLAALNTIYADIVELFDKAGVDDFEKLPEDNAERGVFAKLFRQFNEHLEAAKIQGFVWSNPNNKSAVELDLDEQTYLLSLIHIWRCRRAI